MHEASSSLPSELDSATQEAGDTQTRMTKMQLRKDSTHHEVVEHVRGQQEMSSELAKVTAEIEQFQRYLAYLQLIQGLKGHASFSFQVNKQVYKTGP